MAQSSAQKSIHRHGRVVGSDGRRKCPSLDIHGRKREYSPKTQLEILRIGLQGYDHLATRKDENGMFQQAFKDIGRTLSKHAISVSHRTRRGDYHHDSLAYPAD